MSALQKLLFAHRCTSTHHKIVLDSLRHLRGENAEALAAALPQARRRILAGSIAPDQAFKDFRNHVLHVREKCWGGAVESVESWYKQTVDALSGTAMA